MSFIDLFPFLTDMYEIIWEENLWEVWLHDPMKEKSFNEFKEEAIKNRKRKKTVQEQIQEAKEAERIVNNAFKKKGGRINGNE